MNVVSYNLIHNYKLTPATNSDGMVMLWITQYLILVIISEKGRSPVEPPDICIPPKKIM